MPHSSTGTVVTKDFDCQDSRVFFQAPDPVRFEAYMEAASPTKTSLLSECSEAMRSSDCDETLRMLWRELNSRMDLALVSSQSGPETVFVENKRNAARYLLNFMAKVA